MKAGTRWRVLSRDAFTCRYCGRSAPTVRLHVDHILPKSWGGSGREENLVTACVDCNKSASDGRYGLSVVDRLRSLEGGAQNADVAYDAELRSLFLDPVGHGYADVHELIAALWGDE